MCTTVYVPVFLPAALPATWPKRATIPTKTKKAFRYINAGLLCMSTILLLIDLHSTVTTQYSCTNNIFNFSCTEHHFFVHSLCMHMIHIYNVHKNVFIFSHIHTNDNILLVQWLSNNEKCSSFP